MQKPAYSMSIIAVNPNETVPDALLIKLFSENRSAMGLVVRDGTSIDIEKFAEMDSVEDEVKEMRGILENTKKHHRMLCLSALPAGFNKAEIQPWVIIKDSKDKPILVVACEGDFPKHCLVKDQSEFFTLINDYLGPKIESMFKLLGNDPKKLMDYLRSKDFAAELELVYSERGVFEFMPAEGEPFAHGKNKIGLEATWGRASNVYGYTEAVLEAGTAEPPAEAPKRSKYASDDPAPAKEPVADPPKADPPKTPIEKVAAELPKKRRIDIPRNLHGKRKKAFIRDLYLQHEGKERCPPEWDSMTYVEVDMQTTVKSLADLDKTAVGQVKDMKGDAPILKSNVSENMPVPVISGPQQANVTAFIKKFLDGNSNRVTNPLEIQKVEAKLAVFTEVAGLTTGLDDLDTWPTSILATFVKEHPEAAWLAILEYRADRRKRKQLQALGDKKLSDLTGTEEVPTPGTTQVPEAKPGTASPPEAQPEVKKSRYA